MQLSDTCWLKLNRCLCSELHEEPTVHEADYAAIIRQLEGVVFDLYFLGEMCKQHAVDS